MSGQSPVEPPDHLEQRSRTLFRASVDGLDFARLSRLNQSRSAAIEAASAGRRRPWFLRIEVLTPAGVAAAAVLVASLWLGSPWDPRAVTVADGRPSIEDLDIVASADESSADPLDLLQDDIEFYDWAERAASPVPSVPG